MCVCYLLLLFVFFVLNWLIQKDQDQEQGEELPATAVIRWKDPAESTTLPYSN